MTTEEIIQTIPQQYMPKCIEGRIRISIPYHLYFNPEDVVIEDRQPMIAINVGHSYVHLFKDFFDALIFISK
jgi:hypothetical protein